MSIDHERIRDAVQGAADAQLLQDVVRRSAVALVLSPTQAENALQLLDEREHAKLAMLSDEIHQARTQAEALMRRPLSSALEAHRLNDLLGRGAKAGKELEALRKDRVGPLNNEVRNVNALFAAVTLVLDQLRSDGERRIIAWNQQERARVAREQEEARRRQEEAARKEAEARAANDLAAAEAASREQTEAQLSEPLPAPRAYKSEEATSFTRERWTFQVIKPELVPREYLTHDSKKIAAAVAAGVREIPGVAITQEDKLTVRAR